MKKVLLLFFSLFIFSSVYASEVKIEEEIIKINNIDNYGMQGFTVVKDKLFIVFIEDDEHSSIIKIYDLKEHKFTKQIKHQSLGHANDVTYNSKRNEIVVLHGNGTSLVSIFDGDTYEFKGVVSLSLPIRSIAYVDDYDIYAVRTITLAYKLDHRFKQMSRLPFIASLEFKLDVARQGWTYYKGFLYYSTWSWIRLGGDGSNTIFVFDIDGNYRNEIKTDNSIGELEDVSFYNEQMILGFNAYDDCIKFYVADIPEVPDLVIEETKEDKKSDNHLVIITLGIVILIIGFIGYKKLHV